MKPQERVKAILKSKVEPTWKVLLIAIASYMSDEQLFIWAKPETLAEDTGLSRSTVMVALGEMVARGIITRIDEGRKAKTTRIIWDVLASQEPVKTKRGGYHPKSEDRTVLSEDRTEVSDVRTAPSDVRHEESEDRTDRGPMFGLEGSDVRTRSDQGTHHDDPTSEPTNKNVPPVPVATPSPATQEPPCAAPPQAISTSVPVSTAKEATNTQPGLFPVATADTAESPKKSKKPATKAQKTVNSEDVERIWKHFRQWHPLTKPAVPKGDGEQIATCLKEWTADEIMTVFTWAHESQHNDAVWLRSKDRDCVKTLTVQADFSRRLELAMREQRTKGPAPEKSEQVAPQEDPSAIWDSIIKRRSTGIRIMPDDIPPRTQNAIRAVGGWNQIGLLNDYTEKQARTAFIAAYRNQPLNGHQRTA